MVVSLVVPAAAGPIVSETSSLVGAARVPAEHRTAGNRWQSSQAGPSGGSGASHGQAQGTGRRPGSVASHHPITTVPQGALPPFVRDAGPRSLNTAGSASGSTGSTAGSAGGASNPAITAAPTTTGSPSMPGPRANATTVGGAGSAMTTAAQDLAPPVAGTGGSTGGGLSVGLPVRRPAPVLSRTPPLLRRPAFRRRFLPRLATVPASLPGLVPGQFPGRPQPFPAARLVWAVRQAR